jgi:hypothetical protein
VDAIRFITYTHINQFDTETILRELQPRYYVKGSDWRGRLPPSRSRFARAMASTSLPGHRARFIEPHPSTVHAGAVTRLMNITEFEAAVFAQKPTGNSITTRTTGWANGVPVTTILAGDAPPHRGEEPAADQRHVSSQHA